MTKALPPPSMAAPDSPKESIAALDFNCYGIVFLRLLEVPVSMFLKLSELRKNEVSKNSMDIESISLVALIS
jgi:hypothetical protein